MATKIWNEPLIYQTIQDFKERSFDFLLGQKGATILPEEIELAANEPHYVQLRFQRPEGLYVIFAYDFSKKTPFPALMFVNNISLPPEIQAQTPILAQIKADRLAYLIKLLPAGATTLAEILGISDNARLPIQLIDKMFDWDDSLPVLPDWEDWSAFDWLNARNFDGNVILEIKTEREIFAITNAYRGICLVLQLKGSERKEHFFATLEKIKIGQNLTFSVKQLVDDTRLSGGQTLEFSAVVKVELVFPDWGVNRELNLDPDVEYTFYRPNSPRIYWSAKTFSVLQLVQAVELMHQQCEGDASLHKLCGKGFTYRFLEILRQYHFGCQIDKDDITILLDLLTFFPSGAPRETLEHLGNNGAVKLIFAFLNCLLKEMK
ncbi:hypothetical protein HZB94_01300 [Candidatus Falkowbacteria bacterium]|nr:hypothetical protein [Candidatus Falkowbacteria bacterium]